MPLSKNVRRSIGFCPICKGTKEDVLFELTDRNGGFVLANVCNKHYTRIIRSGFDIRRLSAIISLGLEMNKEGGVIRVNGTDYHITRVENNHQWSESHDAEKVEAVEEEPSKKPRPAPVVPIEKPMDVPQLPVEVKESQLLEEFVKEDPGGRRGRRA